MKKDQRPSQTKKGATVAAVLCFVAAIAIVGTYTFNGYKQTRKNEQLARMEEKDHTNEKTEEANNCLLYTSMVLLPAGNLYADLQ